MFQVFLNQVQLFSQLNDEQIQMISNVCVRKNYKGGTVIFQQNEPGNTFYIVFSGSVKIFTSYNGEEKVLSMFKSGDSFGELSLIDGKPRSASSQTLEDTSLITLSAQNFLEILRTNFEINLCIMRELCQRLRDTNQHVNDLTFLDARTRIIKNLIMLANKHGAREGNFIKIRVALNYDELSQMSNVQKPILMQVLRDLQEKQILVPTATDLRLDLTKLR
jgi:CRP/FNR family transcriptional regulator/CRP/FNR family cyclic AMP-dependent transcriptional regulator